MTTLDPKYVNPDEYDVIIFEREDTNVTLYPQNANPLTADHIQERVEFLSVIQALVDVIDAHGWQGEDHIAYEQAQGLLARK